MQPEGVPPDLQRLYRVSCDPDADFFCGVAPTGEQVLMGLSDGDLVLVSFNPDGTLIGSYRKRVELVIPEHLSAGEKKYEEITQLMQAMEAWQADLGLPPADITIRQFFILEMDIGTADMPDSLLLSPTEVSALPEGEQVGLEQDIARWRATEKYVLWWGKEYWMSKDGEVTDT